MNKDLEKDELLDINGLKDKIEQQPYIFKTLPLKYRANKEFCLFAISKLEINYMYISDELKEDMDLVTMALKKSPVVLKYCGENLKKNDQLFISALEKYSNEILYDPSYLNEDRKNSEEVIMFLAKQDISNLDFAGEKIKQNKEIVKKLIKISYKTYLYIENELKADEDIIDDTMLYLLKESDSPINKAVICQVVLENMPQTMIQSDCLLSSFFEKVKSFINIYDYVDTIPQSKIKVGFNNLLRNKLFESVYENYKERNFISHGKNFILNNDSFAVIVEDFYRTFNSYEIASKMNNSIVIKKNLKF